MTRKQLEHVIRAAATIADDLEIVVIGSQAVLGQFPDAPADLRKSMEADVWPKNHPERWELVDGSIVISKYVAGREKDMEFVRTVIANGMVDEETLRAHLAGTVVDEETRERIAAFIGRDFSGRP